MNSTSTVPALAMFAVAFGAGLLYLNHARSTGAEISAQAAPSAQQEEAKKPSMAGRPEERLPAERVPSPTTESVSSEARGSDKPGAERATAAPAAPNDVMPPPALEVVPDPQTLPVGGEEAEHRGDQLRSLASARYEDAFAPLAQAARSDPDIRNRLWAIRSLRLLGARGDPNQSISSVLREVMSDPDEGVAAHAREAYDEITARPTKIK